MADQPINELPLDPSPSADDFVPLFDNNSGTTKRGALSTLPLSTSSISIPYKFRARITGAWNSPNNAFAKISLSTEDYDTGSNFDAVTNYRFTAPINGFYHFDGRASLTTSGGINLIIVALYKNGTSYIRGNYSFGNSGSGGGSTLSTDLQAVAGDYFELWIYSGGAAAAETTLDQQATFSGHLMSAT